MKAPAQGALAILVGSMFAGGAAAQTGANRATDYLVPSNVADTRALWVNPAGLGAKPEASVTFDVTVLDPGAAGRLGQASLALNSRGLSFGYQRDNLAPGVHGNTYRLGLGMGASGLDAGFAVAFHGGAIQGTGWDLGLRYDWRPTLTLGGVVRNLGRPSANGVRTEVTYVPAITARLLGSALALSGQARLTKAATRGYDVQAGLQLAGHPALGIIARLDTDRSGRRTAFTLALSFGRHDRLGATGSTGGDFSRLAALGLYGVSTRTAVR